MPLPDPVVADLEVEVVTVRQRADALECELRALRKEVVELQTVREQLDIERQIYTQQSAAWRASLTKLETELSTCQGEVRTSRAQLEAECERHDELRRGYVALHEAWRRSEERIRALTQSISWRASAPFRVAYEVMARIIGR